MNSLESGERMRFRSIILTLLVVSPLAAMPGKGIAAESYDSCKGVITALPATITTPGTWCLKQDLATLLASGSAITVKANDVTLDCNDFKLDGSGAGVSTKTFGIRAVDVSNVTVRHCNVRGFSTGIYISGVNGGHLVEDNRLDSNTATGIRVDGDGAVVRKNIVLDTGGSSVVTRSDGIYTRYSVDILDNTVAGVFANTGSTNGIYTDSNASGSVSNNRVRGVLRSATGPAAGIYSANSGRMTLHRNNITGNASASSIGLRCSSNAGRAKDNVILGFATGLSVCANAGGNDVAP